MSTLTEKIQNEPVLVTALVQAAIVVAASFGLDLTAEQTSGIVVLTGALLAFIARSKVSPVTPDPVDPGDDFDGHAPFPG